jgi:hypothetical protein
LSLTQCINITDIQRCYWIRGNEALLATRQIGN